MKRVRKVSLVGGPVDGMTYSLAEENGRLPGSLSVSVPAPRQSDWWVDGPPPEPTPPRVAYYVMDPREPQYKLTPVYRYRPRGR